MIEIARGKAEKAGVKNVGFEVGSIENGKRADFLVLNGDFSLKSVFLAGRELER